MPHHRAHKFFFISICGVFNPAALSLGAPVTLTCLKGSVFDKIKINVEKALLLLLLLKPSSAR
jgi:hypothetical protein